MATREPFENDGTSFISRFISTSAGLGALGAAGHHLWSSVASNKAVNPLKNPVQSVDRTSSGLGKIFKAAGAGVANRSRIDMAEEKALASELVTKLSKSDYLSEIGRNVDETNALLNAVLTTIDDPSTGLDSVLNPSIRDNIVNLATKMTGTSDVSLFKDEIEDLIGGFVSALAGGPEKNRVVWSRHLKESRGIAQELVAPKRVAGGRSKIHKGYQSLDELYSGPEKHSLSNARAQVEAGLTRLHAAGLHGQYDIVTEAGNVYAHVYRSRGSKKEFVAPFPLYLGEKVPGGVVSKKPPSFHGTEAMDFSWRYGRGVMSAQGLKDVRAQAGVPFHSIPAGLSKRDRGLLTSIGAGLDSLGTEDQKLEFIQKNIAGADKRTRKRLQRMAPQQWLSYLQANKGKSPLALPTLSSAFISVEEALQNVLLDEMSGKTSLWDISPRKITEAQRALAIPDQRFSSRSNTALGRHQRAAAAFDQNFMMVLGLEKESDTFTQDLIKELSANPSFEASASPQRILKTIGSGRGAKIVANFGIFQGSPIEALSYSARDYFNDIEGSPQAQRVLPRSYISKLARIEQVTGRPRMFTGSPTRISGIDYGPGGAPVGWSSKLTGATNKAFMMVAEADNETDFAADFYKKWSGTGQVFHTGEEILQEEEIHKIVDPATTKKMQGRLLQAIDSGHTELENRGGAYYLGDERLGTVLGYDTQNRLVKAKADPDTIGASFSIEKKTVKNLRGKDLEQATIIMNKRRRMRTFKGFSPMAKGLFAQVPDAVAQRDLGSIGANNIVDELGLDRKHLAYGVSDLVEKAPGFWDMQLTSAYRMMGGNEDDLRRRTTSIAQNYKFRGVRNHSELLESVVSAFTELAELNNLNPRLVGHALAGVASKSVKDPALRASILEHIEDTSFANNPDFMTALKSRVFFGAAALTPGEGPGDYGAARGSMDKRQAAIIATKLSSMGLGDAQINQITQDLAGRTQFSKESIVTAKGLMGIAAESQGVTSPFKVSNARTIGLRELTEATKDTQLGDFLRAQKDPLRLDLSINSGAASDRMIASVAQKALGFEPITLPTGDLFEALESTFIKDSEGLPRQVSGEFVSEFGHLVSRLQSHSGTPLVSGADQVEEALLVWKQQVTRLAAKAQANAVSGKLAGSMMLPILSYDKSLEGTHSIGISPSQSQYIDNATKLSRGRALMVDDQGFLGMLHNYMGGETDDLAEKAERFFLGPYGMHEGKGGKKHLRSVTALAVRQPALGAGHVAPVEIFRHEGEEAGNEVLHRFQDYIRRSGGKQEYLDISSWGELARMSNAKADIKRSFFRDFIGGLSQFAGEGGGRVFAPRVLEERTFSMSGNTRSVLIDYGMQAAMGADNDSDHVNLIMADSKYAKVLSNASREATSVASDAVYKESLKGYEEAAKDSLKVLAARMNVDMSSLADQLEAIGQDTLKESKTKTATGAIDVKLNQLRFSAFDIATRDPNSEAGKAALRMSAMLTAVQEHTVLKGKKLPLYFPFTDYLGAGLDTAMAGGSTAQLSSVLRENIFGAWKGDLQIGGTKLNLERDLAFLDQVVDNARHGGWAEDVSAGQLAARLMSKHSRRTFDAIESGTGVTGAYVRGYFGDSAEALGSLGADVARRVSSAASSFNIGKGTSIGVGLLGAGVVASMFAPSYSPTPLNTPYDRASPKVASAIRRGQALEEDGYYEMPPQPINPHAMMDRSIDEKTAYVGSPNAFQVRGVVNSRHDLDNLLSVVKLGPMGSGHSSISIQDNRRPITQNYIDRMTGGY